MTSPADQLRAGLESGDVADVIPLQPYPVRTRVVYHRIGTEILTAVYRQWGPGDTARCRLCDGCWAFDDGCLKIFRSFIPRSGAPLASAVGLAANSLAEGGLRLAD